MTYKMFSRLLAVSLATFACLSTGKAATQITYAEIPLHLAPFGTVLAYRGFTVATSDGKTHRGRRLLLEPDHLRIFHGDNSYEDLPSAEITRIEIRQSGRFFHHVVESASYVLFPAAVAFDAPPASIPLLLLTPIMLGYAGAATPFFLAADGVAFLIPPKVYEIKK